MVVRLCLLVLSLLACSACVEASMGAALLPSTGGTPEAIVGECVSALQGYFCKVERDLYVEAPDPLILERYYSNVNPFTGEGKGGWRLFPHGLLILGQEVDSASSSSPTELGEKLYAFTTVRSDGLLTYSGHRREEASTVLSLEPEDATGLVNSYCKEISGRTNHGNSRLYCDENNCELVLGDGTRRFYEKVESVDFNLLNGEMALAGQIVEPCYFRLVEEQLPSGNRTLFSYDIEGRLTRVERRDRKKREFTLFSLFPMTLVQTNRSSL